MSKYGSISSDSCIRVCELISPDGAMRATITNFGARLLSLQYRDDHGNWHETILKYDQLSHYQTDRYFLGASIGRYAGHIPRACFTLPDEQKICVTANAGLHSLHGGKENFSKKLWDITNASSECVRLMLSSADGEEGYPGNLEAHITYRLLNGGKMEISYSASTDQTTLCALTNHSYFAFGGGTEHDLSEVSLKLSAESFWQNDSDGFPESISACEDTPMDFSKPKLLTEALERLSHEGNSAGFDVCYVITGSGLREMARLESQAAGIGMQVCSDAPCMQLYTSNAPVRLPDGEIRFPAHNAVCLEPKGHPFTGKGLLPPDAVLQPEKTYQTVTQYTFYTL